MRHSYTHSQCVLCAGICACVCTVYWHECMYVYIHVFKALFPFTAIFFKLKLRLPYLEVKLTNHSRQLCNLEIWAHNNRHVFFMDSITFSLIAM